METVYDILEQCFGYSKISCQGSVLIAKLDVEGFDIWRKLVGPLYFTFEQLHEIMQTLFDWQDYHLHDFLLLEGEKPLVCLVLDEEMVYDVAPMKAEIETGILLLANPYTVRAYRTRATRNETWILHPFDIQIGRHLILHIRGVDAV